MKTSEIKMVRSRLERRFANVRRSSGGQWTALDHRQGTVKARKLRILIGDDAAALVAAEQYGR